MSTQYDIVIIGCGLSGLSAAAVLSTIYCDSKILLMDKMSPPNKEIIFKNDGRTTALSRNSKVFYDKYGLWTDISDQATEIRDIVITDGQKPTFIHYDNELIDGLPLGYNIENKLLKDHLYNIITNADNVDLRLGQTYNTIRTVNNIYELELSSGDILKSKLFIIAEGANSLFREMCNITTFDHWYQQKGMAFNISHSENHNNVAYERFFHEGPFAILPMQGGYKSSVIWSEKSYLSDMIKQLSSEQFLQLLNKKSGNVLGKISIDTSSNIRTYPLLLKIAKRFHKNNAVFIGDSAHSIHPVAGQGFNLGIMGLETLINRMLSATEIGMDFNSKHILSSFTLDVLRNNISMIISTDLLIKLFGINNPLISKMRTLGIKTVNKSDALKIFFMRQAMGI